MRRKIFATRGRSLVIPLTLILSQGGNGSDFRINFRFVCLIMGYNPMAHW